jgi:hypothetical protein
MRAIVLALVAAGCSTSSPPSTTSTERLADLRYVAATGWTHHDAREADRMVSRWTPTENPNKESISIIRTPIRAAVKGADPAKLEALLAQAQTSLPSPAVRAPTAGRTKRDLLDVEIAADFVPRGLTESYHRVHAMIVDGDVLIHVLYTARTPDPDLTVFRQVVDSIHRGEG